jgi:hypothetical protein
MHFCCRSAAILPLEQVASRYLASENWPVDTMAPLRSRLEAHTVERSTPQLQALLDQMPTSDASVPQRLSYLHALFLPSKWRLERELAHRFGALGAIK